MTKKEPTLTIGAHGNRLLSLVAVVIVWTILVAVGAWSLLQNRLHNHRAQAIATADLRLNGVKEVLAISLRQLGALPLYLSQQRSIFEFLANQHATGIKPLDAPQPRNPGNANTGTVTTTPPEVLSTVDSIAEDFALPMVALIDLAGKLVTGNLLLRSTPSNLGVDLSARDYFTNALAYGSSMQFLLGRASRAPGLYFANRVVRDGVPVGVAVVKQDVDTLNGLLSATEGAHVLITDTHGVVVLGNLSTALMRRVPGAPDQSTAAWEAVYQSTPEVLDWQQSRSSDNSRDGLITTIGTMRHITVSSVLPNTPLKAWVLEPLDEETSIQSAIGTEVPVVWLIGMALLWFSWRRVQLLDVALQAQRDIYELTQALPVTVFRYCQPVDGPAHFAFLGHGVEALFGVDTGAFEKDPELPWRLAGSGLHPPTRPHEFMVRHGEVAAWLMADSTPKLEADGSTTYNGYWLDVSARRETQARFSAVFEHASTGYLFFDPQRGVTHCNPASLLLFGAVDAHTLLGRVPWFPGMSSAMQANGVPSREQGRKLLHEHTETRQRVRSFEWRFQRADASEFDADVSVIALEWAGNPQFCAVIQDITARKQVEVAMVRAREAAEASSQTKSRFLANMSHELRTPMNGVIGMMHLALEDGLPDKQRDYIEKAYNSARNLLQILNDILDVSKIEAGQLTLERIDFELESVVGEMANVLGLRADEKGLELLFSAAPGLPERLIGDPTRLRQVLVNLGGNAIKFTDSGEVTLGMEIDSQDSTSITLHSWVHDTGVGLSQDEIARLFQPFSQADSSTTRRFGGTGLGLVISRQLVERMGGRLWVESVAGQGSTFHFTARFDRSAPRAPTRAWMNNELRGRRALVVDDNPAALDVLGNMLETLGVSVDRVDSGAKALAQVDEAADPYTWVLVDWKMPGMDGIECARQIIERHSPVRPSILLVTGFASDDALRASTGVPLAGVLHKPVTPSSLHDSLVQARHLDAAAPATARRMAATPPLAEAVRQRLAGARILLAEDHPLNQQLACELLRRAGMEVVVAGDGREALNKLQNDGPFDAVLMDCQMPVMDGYDTTRALRADPRFERLPVIAMTASALAEDRERALASGMNAHITKPINVESMLRTMADWIGTHRGAPMNAPGPIGTAAPRFKPFEPGKPDEPPAIDTASGMSYCMDNEVLYLRLLTGFRNAQADFADEVRPAVAELRWPDALRRVHDMKGLAGTIGATRLQLAAQDFYLSLLEKSSAKASAELDVLDTELQRVLHEIQAILSSKV